MYNIPFLFLFTAEKFIDYFSLYYLLLLFYIVSSFLSFDYCRANCDIFLYSYICYSYLYTIIVILSFFFFLFLPRRVQDIFRCSYTMYHTIFFFSFLFFCHGEVVIIVDIIVDIIVLCFIPISMLKFLLFLM